jgi:hypothetical protein
MPTQVEPHHNGSMQKIMGYCYKSDDEKNILEGVMFVHPGAIDTETEESIPVRVCGVYSGATNTSLATIVVHPIRKEEEAPEGAQGQKLYKGPRGQMVGAAEWLNATSGGCTQCKKALIINEAPEIQWLVNETQPLCPGCVEDYKNFCETSTTH